MGAELGKTLVQPLATCAQAVATGDSEWEWGCCRCKCHNAEEEVVSDGET